MSVTGPPHCTSLPSYQNSGRGCWFALIPGYGIVSIDPPFLFPAASDARDFSPSQHLLWKFGFLFFYAHTCLTGHEFLFFSHILFIPGIVEALPEKDWSSPSDSPHLATDWRSRIPILIHFVSPANGYNRPLPHHLCGFYCGCPVCSCAPGCIKIKLSRNIVQHLMDFGPQPSPLSLSPALLAYLLSSILRCRDCWFWGSVPFTALPEIQQG